MSTTTDLKANFVKALSYHITVSGKTKKEIAEAIGVPPTTFSSWSNGKHLPDMEKLQTLADYLGAPVSQFFDYSLVIQKTDPLLAELIQVYPVLSDQDKLILKNLSRRFIQLYKE